MKDFLIKLKNAILSVRGIKATLSIILAIVAYLVGTFDFGASLAILTFIVGLWIDEVIEFIFKLCKGGN